MQLGITLTGADERTMFYELNRLADIGAEIGVLYSATPQGRPRYPDYHFIYRLANCLGERMALHVCGRTARNALLEGRLWAITRDVPRIQVNGVLAVEEVTKLCDLFPKKTIITQHKVGNESLIAVDRPNHAVLVDESGGEGRVPDVWRRPDLTKRCGFAGGLGPHNLADHLPRISAVANGFDTWVDMESSLAHRADWFDAGRAYQAIGVWMSWSNGHP